MHVKSPARCLLQGQGSKRQLPTIDPLALVPTVGWGMTFRPTGQQSFLELQINTVSHQKERGLRLGRGPSESAYFVGTSVSNTQLWTAHGNIPVFAETRRGGSWPTERHAASASSQSSEVRWWALGHGGSDEGGTHWVWGEQE